MKYRKLSNKNAFSFVEIAIVIFFILAISSITLSKIFIETRCPASVYKWQQTLEEVKYAYNVALLTKGSSVAYIKSRSDINTDTAFLELFQIGMNLKKNMTKQESDNLEKYSYYFLNGKKVTKKSQYYVKDFVYTSGGELFGLKWKSSTCEDESVPCGFFVVDLNGITPPNKFGVDVFGADIYKNNILPFGEDKQLGELTNNCNKRSFGVYCSKYYLICGKFN